MPWYFYALLSAVAAAATATLAKLGVEGVPSTLGHRRVSGPGTADSASRRRFLRRTLAPWPR
jgi:hypothetical protein